MKWRRWVLLELWLLSLIAISNYGGVVSYGFFFGITLIPVISWIYLLLVYWRFKIYQELSGRNMVCGDAVPYFFVLQNDDYFAYSSVSVRLFSSFSYVEEIPDGIEYELLPKDKFTYEAKLVCKYRGEYEVGIKEIVLTDFFGLFQLRYSMPGTIKALVLPKIVRVRELGVIDDLAAFLQKESVLMQTEPDVLVRDYMEKDDLKQIHWKLTAREQKLKVRTRTGEEKSRISILFDTGRYDQEMKEYLPLENKILEAVIALGIFFAEKSIPFSAYYKQNGMMKSDVEDISGFDGFYQKAAGIVFDEKNELISLFDRTMEEGILWNSKIVFCVLHRWEDAVSEITKQLAAGGVIVVVYLITQQPAKQFIKQSSLRRRIIVIPPDAELEGKL